MNDPQSPVELTLQDTACAGMRADRYVAEHLRLFTRSQLKSREVGLEINGKEAKWSHRLSLGDVVRLTWEPELPTNIVPEPVEIDIIYENEDVVVVDKPQGMVVHPAAGNYSGTLVQGLAYRSLVTGDGELSADNPRPGIVHRLDKDTSGVMIAAKTPLARQFLANQFAKKHTGKVYLAVVKGMVMPRNGHIEEHIVRDPKNRKRFTTSEEEGKPAVTDYRVLCQWEDYAFLALRPSTGRTHQLRVHLSSRGHPVLGDPIYSRRDARFPDATLMLHAHRLRILLPRRVPDSASAEHFHYEGGEIVQFRSPMPERFKSFILAQSAFGPNTRGRSRAR